MYIIDLAFYFSYRNNWTFTVISKYLDLSNKRKIKFLHKQK